MRRSTPSLEQAGRTLGYGAFGVGVTAIVALVVLNLTDSGQAGVYDRVYLHLGPSGATEVAILAHFLAAGMIALGVTMVAADYLSDRGANIHAVGVVFAAMLALVVGFLVVAVSGLAAFLTVLLVLAVAFLGVPLWLRYRSGVRSGAVPAFVGGIPVIVLLLFLAGFGLGWGWGYVVVAEEIPESSVDGPVADMGEMPEVRDDLFAGDCESSGEDRRQCHLQLRGYEHEVTAAQFMERQGVRCPYQTTYSGEEDAFIADDDGTYYRVTCSPHGD